MSSAVGYCTQRFSTEIKTNDTFQFNANSYMYGGNTANSVIIPRYGDQDQWYHVMCIVLTDSISKWFLNGRDIGDNTVSGTMAGPWVNAANSLGTYLFSRRYAGATAVNRTYEGWLHNYFICDLDSYVPAFADRGVKHSLIHGQPTSLANTLTQLQMRMTQEERGP